MNETTKSITKYLVLLVVTVLIGVWAVFYLLQASEDSNTATLPKGETPSVVDELPPELETVFVDLIKPTDNYRLTVDPYLPDNYKTLSRRLALMGEFEVARLHIMGKLDTDEDHFLSLNIGTESGVYNAVRKASAEGLDISLTKENGGVFSIKNPINVEINLLGQQTLSTTQKEYSASRNTSKLVRFWDFIQPQPPAPSVNRILAAPFNKKGIYTGTIDSLRFEYRCGIGSKCSVAVCEDKILATECLLNNFGKTAKESWEVWYRSVTE